MYIHTYIYICRSKRTPRLRPLGSTSGQGASLQKDQVGSQAPRWIEPLSGVCRNPLANICPGGHKDKFDARFWAFLVSLFSVPYVSVLTKCPPSIQVRTCVSACSVGEACLDFVDPFTYTLVDPSVHTCLYTHMCIRKDVQYLILENFCGQNAPKPKAKLFDLGCSTNARKDGRSYDFLNVDYSKGSGFGPSLPLTLSF